MNQRRFIVIQQVVFLMRRAEPDIRQPERSSAAVSSSFSDFPLRSNLDGGPE
jgi:hypothetical protein